MKNALLLIAQTILFLIVFLAGTLWDPFHLKWFVTHPSPGATRFFVPDGLILIAILYLLIVIIEAVAKRFETAGRWTSIAFVIAIILGLMSKFGLATHDIY